MIYDFLYTNVGKGLLDENTDYSIKRFGEYDGVKALPSSVRPFLLSLEAFCKREGEELRTLAENQSVGSYLVLQGMHAEKLCVVLIVHAELGKQKARRAGDFSLEGRVFLAAKIHEIPELAWEKILACNHPLPWMPRFTNLSEAKLQGWMEDEKLSASGLPLLSPNTILRMPESAKALGGKAEKRKSGSSFFSTLFIGICLLGLLAEYFFFMDLFSSKETFWKEKATALGSEILSLSHSLDLLDKLASTDPKIQEGAFLELERKIEDVAQNASIHALDFKKNDFVPLAYKSPHLERYIKPSLNLIDNEVLVSELHERIQKQTLQELQSERNLVQSPYLRFLLQKKELSDWSKRVAKRLYWQEICATFLEPPALYSPFQIYRLMQR